MTPSDFVLWLNGAAELVGDEPPNQVQWALMKSRLGETVGKLVAAKMYDLGGLAAATNNPRLQACVDSINAYQAKVANYGQALGSSTIGYNYSGSDSVGR